MKNEGSVLDACTSTIFKVYPAFCYLPFIICLVVRIAEKISVLTTHAPMFGGQQVPDALSRKGDEFRGLDRTAGLRLQAVEVVALVSGSQNGRIDGVFDGFPDRGRVLSVRGPDLPVEFHEGRRPSDIAVQGLHQVGEPVVLGQQPHAQQIFKDDFPGPLHTRIIARQPAVAQPEFTAPASIRQKPRNPGPGR